MATVSSSSVVDSTWHCRGRGKVHFLEEGRVHGRASLAGFREFILECFWHRFEESLVISTNSLRIIRSTHALCMAGHSHHEEGILSRISCACLGTLVVCMFLLLVTVVTGRLPGINTVEYSPRPSTVFGGPASGDP